MPVVCWLAVWWALSLGVAWAMFSRAPELDENMMPVSTRQSPRSRPTTPGRYSLEGTSRQSSTLTRSAPDGRLSSQTLSALSMRNPFLTVLKDSVTDPTISSPLARLMAGIEMEQAMTEAEDFRLWQADLP